MYSLPAPKLRPIKTQAVERHHASSQHNRIDATSQLDKENVVRSEAACLTLPLHPALQL